MEKLHRTDITLTVLSDRPILDDELGAIIENCDTGDCVLSSLEQKSEEITPAEMAQALTSAGSEPEFFQLGQCPSCDTWQEQRDPGVACLNCGHVEVEDGFDG